MGARMFDIAWFPLLDILSRLNPVAECDRRVSK